MGHELETHYLGAGIVHGDDAVGILNEETQKLIEGHKLLFKTYTMGSLEV